MIVWDDKPPREAAAFAFDLIRTPTKGKLSGTVTSDNLLGTWTHFRERRTRPCQGDDCPHCKDGISRRWHGWLTMILLKLNNHVILEVTAQAAERILKWKEDHKSLRGVTVHLWRPQETANGRIAVYLEHRAVDLDKLPLAPNLHEALLFIWGAPSNNGDEHPVGPNRIEKMLDLENVLKNGQGNRT